MAVTPKPIRKKEKAEKTVNREFLRKYSPSPTKQKEKKSLNKQMRHEIKLNVHESPKHEKLRKSKI